MSRFWQKLIHVCPPFDGTPEQMKENFERLEQEFDENYDDIEE